MKISFEDFYKLSDIERINFIGIAESPSVVVYLKKGFFHREDGPAVIHPNGYKEYWINDEHLKNCHSDEALKLYVDMLRLKKI
jgi:hypothetical protein